MLSLFFAVRLLAAEGKCYARYTSRHDSSRCGGAEARLSSRFPLLLALRLEEVFKFMFSVANTNPRNAVIFLTRYYAYGN